MPRLLHICFPLLILFWQLLFKGSIYFFGKTTDINNGWIRHVQVRRWWLLDAGSSLCSHSVLLSAMETSCTTQTALALDQTVVPIPVHVLGMLATVTIQGRCLFHSKLLILRLLIGILPTASVVIVLAWLKKKSSQCQSKEIYSWTICLIVTYWSGVSTMISTNVSTPAICENTQEWLVAMPLKGL